MDNFTIAVNKYLRDFAKLRPKSKIVITGILIVSFFLGLGIPQVVKNLSTPPVKAILPSPTPIPIPPSVSLTSDKNRLTAGATFSATININSPNQGIEAADIVVNFDPKVVKVATISAGNFFGLYPVKQIEKNRVKISGIANLVNNKFVIPIGRGQIASVSFKTLVATESTKITFDRENTIIASGGKNILDMEKITDLEISIK